MNAPDMMKIDKLICSFMISNCDLILYNLHKDITNTEIENIEVLLKNVLINS